MKTNVSWKKAQKKELSSWLETDMKSEQLLKYWKKRKNDFKLIIQKLDKKSNVLDLCSGPVPVIHTFPKTKLMVAIDSLEDKYKKKYNRLKHITYICDSAEKINFPKNTFDASLCINALDHVKNYKKVLLEMIRCSKKDALIYLEYENTSPLSIFLAKIGYKKPLYDFHPLLLENKEIVTFLEKHGCQLIYKKLKPQFNRDRLKAIFSILFSKRKMTSYEKNISSLNYGIIKSIFHYLIIFIERILYIFSKVNYAYFTIFIFKKK